MRCARQVKRTIADPRHGMYASINISWAKLNPDLDPRTDKDELRDARLSFITGFLDLREPLESITDLTDKQLGMVCAELRRHVDGEAEPARPRRTWARRPAKQSKIITPPAPIVPGVSAEIIHLATPEQTFTIEKLFAYLVWDTPRIEGFLFKRYRRRNARMLKPKDASGLIRILFNIAASACLKQRYPGEKISRQQISAEIPALKARLGIDQ